MYDQKLFARLQSSYASRFASARDVWLVFEGDWGGQVYLTVPWRLVGTSARIFSALRYLDGIAWDCNEGDGTSAYLEAAPTRKQSSTGIAAGMGGGALECGPWLHEEFSVRQRLLAYSLLDLPGSRPLPSRA